MTLNATVQTIQTKPPQLANDNISLIKRGMDFLTSQMFFVCSMFCLRSRQASPVATLGLGMAEVDAEAHV